MERIMKRLILLPLLALMLVSCTTATPETSSDKEVISAVTRATPHPLEPDWVTFTSKPVVKEVKIGDKTGFIVSDEFIERSLQLQDYSDRIKIWKRKNLVP